jgi:sec-independent protein translocase protein TatA
MLIGGLGTPEILIIAIVILLLFGGKKIPELMKGMGKGIRSFKKGLNEDDDNSSASDNASVDGKNGEEVK